MASAPWRGRLAAVRLRCRPLSAVAQALSIDGTPRPLELWHQRLTWQCRDGAIDLRILAAEALVLPEAEPSEPVPGAIARVVAAVAGHGALIVLANPAVALGPERMAFATGIRLLGIASEEDQACWDALLALGQPCYGVRDEVVAEVINPRPAGLLSALAYGVFYCHDALEPIALDETPHGVAWRMDQPVSASVIGRGGFELASMHGTTGSYADTGTEGTVRVVLTSDQGTCWTQPRFVAPRQAAGHG